MLNCEIIGWVQFFIKEQSWEFPNFLGGLQDATQWYYRLSRLWKMSRQLVSNLVSLINSTDYLYLDLNGIVHNAIHGNDPKRHERISKLDDLEELWASIMRSIDEIVHIVKPKKMLFLAVDGVAPRAKMN